MGTTITSQQTEFFAPCSKGLEQLLADELRALGARRVRPLTSGVAFFGGQENALRALLWSRLASRVLLVLGRGAAGNSDELYELAAGIAWEDHILPSGTFCVDAQGTNDALRDSRFVALRVKDAVCDRIRQHRGERPSVDRELPDVRVNVVVRSGRATIALDLAGEPLHRRGYRVKSKHIAAPLRETLAAAMLAAAGWGDPSLEWLLDPLCGSGTIAIEAALMATDRAPGLLRAHWGFERWLGLEGLHWDALIAEADERAEAGDAAASERGRERGSVFILASDISEHAIDIVRKSARKAGVERLISAKTLELSQAVRPGGRGLIACNPPYGERMAHAAQLPAIYAAIRALRSQADGQAAPSTAGQTAKETSPLLQQPEQSPSGRAASPRPPKREQGYPPACLCIISSDTNIDSYIGEHPASTISTYNGPIEARIACYPSGSLSEAALPATAGLATDCTAPQGEQDHTVKLPQPSLVSVGAHDQTASHEQFANRLRKTARHRAKWARRAEVSCYRVYDADLPDYNVAIDVYNGATGTPDEGRRWLHIAEYAPPAHIDASKAQERLVGVLALAPEILGVSASDVFLKQRKRSKGGRQYAELAQGQSKAGCHYVSEAGLLFEIDLASHLDTGIFLDHRDTRMMLQGMAAGRDALNLFAYTGTASAHMAAGGAASVATVDLSASYLDVARRNMAANGFKGERFSFEQADVLRWVGEHRHSESKFGLIFCDPPTFSNSSSMGKRSWDVQRDHGELLIALSRMLAASGVVVFSTNLRGFKPDEALLAKAGVELEDVTARTIPEDFRRPANANPVHRCYIARRTGR